MDVKLLHDLKLEIDRIYVSGIRKLRNNPRLPKILLALEKYVEEDEAYRDLVVALKELTHFGFVKYTSSLARVQASLDYLLRLHKEVIIADGETADQVPVFDINTVPARQHSFQELMPLMNALSETEAGDKRLGIILKAREEKLFEDFRTYACLDRALADKQLEVVELVENIIRTDLGDKMLPFLLAGFEYNDNSENLRRFTLLCELKYEGLGDLLDDILDSEAVNLQVRAIQYMTANRAYEDQIISLTDSSQKWLREAALLAVAGMKTEKAEQKLYDLYAKALKKKHKGEIELAAKALSQTDLRYTAADVLELAKECFNNLITANKKVDVDLFNTLRMAISVLKSEGRPEVYDFFLQVLFDTEYSEIIKKKKQQFAKPAKDISYAIIGSVQHMDIKSRMAFYEKVITEMPESEWKQPFYKMYLNAHINNGSSVEQIYEIFAPYYLNKSIDIEDIAELCGVDKVGAPLTVDSRWLDLLYETLSHIDEQEKIDTLLRVLDALESQPSERYNQELIKAGRSTKKYLLEVTSMIIKRNISDKYEVVFSLIKHCHDQGSSGSNALRQLPRATYWAEFPKEYAAKIKELKNAPRAIYNKIVES